jgi:nitrite reductase/ring-hydroxylating ferredoxin subunit
MVKGDENTRLTESGSGTPMGALLRCYWQPIALAEELPSGGAPLPIRIMGEDLVLFRDEEDRLGLLARACSHRCADLSYGRLEDGGLRCLYHGWLYDVHGNCLEQPGEPPDSTYKDAIKHKAYPVREVSEIIFAYMGGGAPPSFPEFEFLQVDPDYRTIHKVHQECNFLQACEGEYDPAHVSYLHRRVSDEANRPRLRGGAADRDAANYLADNIRPQISYETTDYGLRIFTTRPAEPGKKYLRVTNYILPTMAAIAGRQAGDGYTAIWRVPVDDENHLRFGIQFQRTKPIDRARFDQINQAEITDDYRPIRNRRNRYLQDREAMNKDNFTGMGPLFLIHDAFASETQGAVHDRSREHLGTTDVVIQRVRRLLLEAMDAVEKGEDPPNIFGNNAKADLPDLVVVDEIVDETTDNLDFVKDVIANGPRKKPGEKHAK